MTSMVANPEHDEKERVVDADGLSRPNHSRKPSKQLDSLTYWKIETYTCALFTLSNRLEIALLR
jgi:hypothetical protein